MNLVQVQQERCIDSEQEQAVSHMNSEQEMQEIHMNLEQVQVHYIGFE